MATDVGPHDFQALTKILHRKDCKACFVHRDRHPVSGWVPARPLGDKSRSRKPKVYR